VETHPLGGDASKRRVGSLDINFGTAFLRDSRQSWLDKDIRYERIVDLDEKDRPTPAPNHLGMALHRHRRAGQLENRNQRWYLPPSA
jgi:hypothetical protein